MWGWYWGPGWIAGLISAVFWIVIVVLAVVLLRRELPHLQTHHRNESPALRLLEERYARGEVSRAEFLHRRDVLLGAYDRGPAPGAAPQYSPRDAHVRVSSATPPPRPGDAPPAPPPPAEGPVGAAPPPVPDPGAVHEPGEGPRRAGPAEPTEPLPPVPPPGE